MQTGVICVDFQKDFSSKEGIGYHARSCIEFFKDKFTPYCRESGLKIAEIVSDYRLPRPGDEFECCVPGTPGYESEIPADIKRPDIWVKCMNSPEWIRENGGLAEKPPGLPYQDASLFTRWLDRVIGKPTEVQVVLIGLTLDCCVLCTAQALSFRAYPVFFLVEGEDSFSGQALEKEQLLKIPASNWGQPLSWENFKVAADVIKM